MAGPSGEATVAVETEAMVVCSRESIMSRRREGEMSIGSREQEESLWRLLVDPLYISILNRRSILLPEQSICSMSPRSSTSLAAPTRYSFF